MAGNSILRCLIFSRLVYIHKIGVLMKYTNSEVDDFDFSGFIDTILKFNKTIISQDFDPTFAIVEVPEIGGVPIYGSENDGRDIYSELVNEGKRLFFPFSATNVGEPIPCADGNSYELDEENGELCMGVADSIGYLVEIENGKIVIHSAIHCGGACVAPPPSVDLLEDCEVFEEPMMEFLERFVGK